MPPFVLPYLTPAILTDDANDLLPLVELKFPGVTAIVQRAEQSPVDMVLLKTLCGLINRWTGATPPTP